MSKKEYPSPNRQAIYTKWIISIDKLRRIQPEIISQPTYQICRRFIKLSDIALPNSQMLPVPIKCYPTNRIQHPKNRQVKCIPSRDVTSSSSTRAVTRETISKILLVWHQLRSTCIQCTFNENQRSCVQAQCNSMMYKKITWTNW